MDLRSFMLSSAYFFVFFTFSDASDGITLSEFLRDDGSTLVSAGGTFELGFFTPGSSGKRYVGIWYKNIPVRTVVWVANCRNPINDSSGTLIIDSTLNLALVGKNNTVYWTTNLTTRAQTPTVELLDSGNLVLRETEDANSENYLWQSFDYPTDTMLPEMKIGLSFKTGLDRQLIAWKNWDDPSPGYLNWKIQPNTIPQSILRMNSSIFYRGGLWMGVNTKVQKSNPVFSFEIVKNQEEVFYRYHQKVESVVTRLVVNQTNNRMERFTWNNDSQSWALFKYWPVDYCDTYALCGVYGVCITSNTPVCKCLEGFRPRLQDKWDSGNWSGGCVRNKPLDCHGDGFVKVNDLKLPDTTYTWVNTSMEMKECRAKCLENCTCNAYSAFDVRDGGSGCVSWFNDLTDFKQISSGDDMDAQDLYIRVSASESDELNERNSAPGKKIIPTAIAVVTVITGVIIAGYYFHRNKRVKGNKVSCDSNNDDHDGEDLELPLFDFNEISNATSEFSLTNKLGEGGFGTVYKGTLLDGQEIAVKRLSRNSGQGLEQFENEVILIAKLQHRNLVKLLGCCIQGEEKMLIYEYMPNKSLDSCIFDQRRAKLLDWSKRLNIICGIARGLLYLHQDSRLRIIHRDLKTSNVLLDNEMNPKISDFGMARFIRGDQTEGNTKRVAGTYGYMAPEYASDGLFSVKSDVFSFGIIMLEIISGKRSRGFYHPDSSMNLIGYAWRLWKENRTSELIDSFLAESSDVEEVIRCIHISLLCVQHYLEDRPSMASVILMLSSENHALPLPKKPGFCKLKTPYEADSSSCKIASPTNCDVTVSMVEPR